MAFAMPLHSCHEKSCALNSYTLRFRCCKDNSTFSTGCKLEVSSNKEKNTFNAILRSSEYGSFSLYSAYIVDTVLGCLYFSAICMDGSTFALSSVDEFKIGTLQIKES